MKPDLNWFTCFHRNSAPGRTALGLLALLAAAHTAAGADAGAGKAAFKVQCALCHTAEPGDNGGAQGPGLAGVFGRKAASAPSFFYTHALRDSALRWDAATLDRFLQAPTTVVPGSSMVVPVAGREDRQNIIAYLQTLKPDAAPAMAPVAAPGEQDWKNDQPGRVHRIDLAKLRAPFATPSVRNRPALIERPVGAQPRLPAGFRFDTFARGLLGPRRMIVAANGDVIVSETRGGRIAVMRPAADGSKAESVTVFADGLKQPFGLALYPDAKRAEWLYVAETHRIIRYPFRTGERKAGGAPEVVVEELPTGGHYTRDVVFSPDGRLMYVSVGSATNVADTMEKKTPDEIRAWEAEHGLGAAWGPETNRATVLVYPLGSRESAKIFASGIRNCVSLTFQPKTHDLWCTTNERDLLGDDLVPDYSTRVKQGMFYGWPWYYMGEHEDPRLKGARPDLKGRVAVPDVPYQAHSAALNLVFYTATSGKSAFPKEYVGDAFAVLHGSWNRAFRTGHKVVRVRMKNGAPVGEYEDFLTGFIVDDGNAWGRPVAAVMMDDGSLLLSDDGANVVYRISYSKP